MAYREAGYIVACWSLRVWCFRHRNGEIEIFGWVQSVDQFHEMIPALYNER